MQEKNEKKFTKYNSFSDRLRAARITKSLSQNDLARKIGYKRGASISNIEAGKSEPDIESLQKLADVLDVDLHWLITGEPSPGERSANAIKSKLTWRLLEMSSKCKRFLDRRYEMVSTINKSILAHQNKGYPMPDDLIELVNNEIEKGVKDTKELQEEQLRIKDLERAAQVVFEKEQAAQDKPSLYNKEGEDEKSL